jgi:hypothetical protein
MSKQAAISLCAHPFFSRKDRIRFPSFTKRAFLPLGMRP